MKVQKVRGRPSKKRIYRRLLDKGRRVAAALYIREFPGHTYVELARLRENGAV